MSSEEPRTVSKGQPLANCVWYCSYLRNAKTNQGVVPVIMVQNTTGGPITVVVNIEQDEGNIKVSQQFYEDESFQAGETIRYYGNVCKVGDDVGVYIHRAGWGQQISACNVGQFRDPF